MAAGNMFKNIWLESAGKVCCRLESAGKVFRAHIGGNGKMGVLRLFDWNGSNSTGKDAIIILHGSLGDIVVVNSKLATEVFEFRGAESKLVIGNEGHPGVILVRDHKKRVAFDFSGKDAALKLGGKPVGQTEGKEGDLIVFGKNGLERVWLTGEKSAYMDQEGHILVRDTAGKNTVVIDGDKGDIILKGGDCAEEFEVCDGHDIEPGMVVESAGGERVRPATSAFSRAVVGVVSGANGLGPGVILHRMHGRRFAVPVALAGKVYCKADASYGAIAVGDLLASSPTAGYAMRVDEPGRRVGCTIGKALEALTEGKGEILMLVGMR